MRQTFVNITLILLFIVFAIVTIRPLLAKIYFYAGEASEAGYHWIAADERFDLAVRLDPLKAEYHAGIGRAYAKRAVILKNKIAALLNAEGEYKKAHELNLYNVRHLMELAAVELELFSTDTTTYSDRLANAIAHFKESFKKDPYNYIVNYDIGRNLLRLWSYLREEDKQFALDQFRRRLELIIWQPDKIYSMLWDKLKDFEVIVKVTPIGVEHYEGLYGFIKEKELWEYRRRVLGLLNECRENEEPQLFQEERLAKMQRIERIKEKYAKFLSLADWEGVSKDGKGTYKKGNMYWEGTADRLIYLPPGTKSIAMKARGLPANGVYPFMVVELDGEEIGETYVDSPEWREYIFDVGSVGLTVLSVTFVNDVDDKKKGEDRNLYVGDVRIEVIGNES